MQNHGRSNNMSPMKRRPRGNYCVCCCRGKHRPSTRNRLSRAYLAEDTFHLSKGQSYPQVVFKGRQTQINANVTPKSLQNQLRRAAEAFLGGKYSAVWGLGKLLFSWSKLDKRNQNAKSEQKAGNPSKLLAGITISFLLTLKDVPQDIQTKEAKIYHHIIMIQQSKNASPIDYLVSRT